MCPSGREPTTQTGKSRVQSTRRRGSTRNQRNRRNPAGQNDSVEVSDAAASGDKIILTPYRITSISQVLGAVSVPGVIETKEVSALATGQSNPFVRNVYESSPPFTCGQGVQMSARITARITGNAEGGGGGVKIEVVNALTGKADPLYRNSTAEAQNTNLNIDETISYLFTGAAQKYYIRITVEASAAGNLRPLQR